LLGRPSASGQDVVDGGSEFRRLLGACGDDDAVEEFAAGALVPKVERRGNYVLMSSRAGLIELAAKVGRQP
jgi:hypothetical protein